MKLEHEFTVPVPVEQAWGVLLDIERIAPCLPGAVIDAVTDDGFTGRVKVKVGPITVSYAGEGRFVQADQSTGHVVIEARGRETRGSGTAKATIAAQLSDDGGATRVSVQTDLAITGKPAQFGRGVMVDVGGKLLGQFADCLAERLGEVSSDSATDLAAEPERAPEHIVEPVNGPESQAVAAATDPAPLRAAPPVAASQPRPAPRPAGRPVPREEPVAIDLLGTAAGPLLKRLAPLAGGAAVLVLLWLAVRRRR